MHMNTPFILNFKALSSSCIEMNPAHKFVAHSWESICLLISLNKEKPSFHASLISIKYIFALEYHIYPIFSNNLMHLLW